MDLPLTSKYLKARNIRSYETMLKHCIIYNKRIMNKNGSLEYKVSLIQKYRYLFLFLNNNLNKDKFKKEHCFHYQGSIESLGSKEDGYLLDPFLAFDYLNLLK